MSGGARILWSDDGAGMAQIERLSIFLFRQVINMERIGHIRRNSEVIFRRYGTERGTLTVVEGAAVADVSKEIRAASADMMRDFPSLYTATVIEGRGFRAVAGRAIVAGMSLLAGHRAKQKMFDDVAEAAGWLVPLVPAGDEPIDVAATVAVVDSLRARLG